MNELLGYIYFAHSNGYIKIGFTDSWYPRDRIETLQVGNPHRIKIVRLLSGTKSQEKWLHKQFVALKTDANNEWFSFTQDMMTIVPPPMPYKAKESPIEPRPYKPRNWRHLDEPL